MNEGWHSMVLERPESGALIQFGDGSIGYAKDLRPESNISNLKWRYTGIGLEAGYGKPSKVGYEQSYLSSLGLAPFDYGACFKSQLGM